MEEGEKIVLEVVEFCKIEIKSIGFDKNYLHLVNDLGKFSELQLRKLLKGTSGKKVLKKFKCLKKK